MKWNQNSIVMVHALREYYWQIFGRLFISHSYAVTFLMISANTILFHFEVKRVKNRKKELFASGWKWKESIYRNCGTHVIHTWHLQSFQTTPTVGLWNHWHLSGVPDEGRNKIYELWKLLGEGGRGERKVRRRGQKEGIWYYKPYKVVQYSG